MRATPKAEPRTQHEELATALDRLAIGALVTEYAVALGEGDWSGYPGLFAQDGRAADCSAAGSSTTDPTRTAE